MRNMVMAGACALALTLTGCGGIEASLLSAQDLANTGYKAENAYAAQPFCGTAGAPKAPACADPEAVIDMAKYSREAQDLLDGAHEALDDPALKDASVETIAAAAINAVGKFAGILAKYHVPLGTK